MLAPLAAAFLLLALPTGSLAAPTLAWRNPATLANPLPALSAVLFDAPGCPEATRVSRRDLTFPQAPPASILVVSAPVLTPEDIISVEDLRSAELLVGGDDERRLVDALADRIACGVEVRFVELENLGDVLDDNSELNRIASAFAFTLLTSLSPASLLALAPPKVFSELSFASRKARVASLIKGATSGPSGILIATAWVLGLLFIARRVYTNRKAAQRDQRELEGEDGEYEALLYARGSMSEMHELV